MLRAWPGRLGDEWTATQQNNRQGVMKKRQAEEYFQQLKRIDKDRDIKLAELINILTGGAITVRQFYQFTDHLKGNEFGEYNHIDERIDQKDWRQLDFPQVYELLKAIKDFILKHQAAVPNETPLALSRNSELGSQVLSQKDNATVLGLLSGLSASLDPVAQQEREQRRFQQKWKAYKLRVLKKLLIIFDFYRKAMCVRDETFLHNSELSQRFDLTMFMRYFRDFELSPAFELPRVLRLFKANAVNTLWLDFDRFVDTHLQLVGCKEGLSHQERYLKLRGLNELLSAEKIKRMLNIRHEHIATVVQGHTGAYKEDIIKHLQIKSQERKERISKKWSGKLKTERSAKEHPTLPKGKHSSLKSLRAKTEAGPSVYQQLKLPKLRVKQQRQESVYQSLNQLELSREQEKIRQLIGMEEGEEYLQAYLKREERLRENASSKPKLPQPLPRMKFT